jgi:hypothetical protein
MMMMLVTLHVSAAEVLRACATQSNHHQVKHEGCDKPSSSKTLATSCCAAMTSCGISLVFDGATDESRTSPDRAPLIPVRASLPSALGRTPEPPPPKGMA